MKEVCSGFVGFRRDALFSLPLEEAPSGMEFSSWLLIHSKEGRFCYCCKTFRTKCTEVQMEDGNVWLCKKHFKELNVMHT